MKDRSIILEHTNEMIYSLTYGDSFSDNSYSKDLTFINARKYKSDNIIQACEITNCREECILSHAITLKRSDYNDGDAYIVYTSMPLNSPHDVKDMVVLLDKIKQHKIDINKNIKISKMLLNIIEEEVGWKKSTFFKLVPIIDDKSIGRQKIYIPFIEELPYFSFNSSKRWFMSPQTMSLYLLIIRIGFSAGGFFKNVKNIRSLYKACDNFSDSTSSDDSRFVEESYRYWIRFLSSAKDIYKGLKKGSLFQNDEDGEIAYYGIQSLVCDDINIGPYGGNYSNSLKTVQKRFNELVK